MSIIDCDYLPAEQKVAFPPELALLIVRKACRMAEAFEAQAVSQMKRDAYWALQKGTEPEQIAMEMGLAK